MDASSAKSMQLSKLPLFPLQTVLFPDGVLPLRIFELRYLDMSVLRSERQKFGLWVGDVEPVDADAVVPVPDDLAFAREALQALVLNIEKSIEPGAGLPLRELRQWDDCGWLANRWCELLPLDTELKQRFMALDSPVLRLELAADTLGQMGFAPPR